MNLFRNLLFWLVLALVGALVAQQVMQDPGEVYIRIGREGYRMTLVVAVLLLAAGLAALWLLWTVLALPFRGWRGFRRRQMRARPMTLLERAEAVGQARSSKVIGRARRNCSNSPPSGTKPLPSRTSPPRRRPMRAAMQSRRSGTSMRWRRVRRSPTP